MSTLVAPVIFALLMSAGGSETRAQDAQRAAPTQQPPEAQTEEEARRGNAQLGLLRVLNLTPEQRAQIGAIRRETEPQGRLLGTRLRQARRALDEAMYSDKPDEAVIEQRVREAGEAQAAVMRLRTLTELKIRRVLSPEQLNAFRQLQRQTRARQRRLNQTSLPGNAPDGEAAPADERLRNRIQRRRQERRQLRQPQQPLTTTSDAQTPSVPRERQRAPLRNPRTPRP